MLRIEIKSKEVVTDTIEARGDREAFKRHTQAAVLVTDDERKKFAIRLSDPSKAYAPGAYEIAGESFNVNRWGSLELADVRLVPVK